MHNIKEICQKKNIDINNIKIDLGSSDKCPPEYIGVDKAKVSGADIIHDCEDGLPFEDNSISEYRAWDFLEHIHQNKFIYLMDEIWRTLKPNGLLKFKVPDAERGQGAFQDITHYTFLVRNSFLYYANDYYRKLYGIKARFKIEKLENIEYDTEYFGKIYAIIGILKASKKSNNIQKKTKENYQNILRWYLDNNFVITTDDFCPSNLKNFEYWDKVKEKYPELKIIAFTIANYKEQEPINESKEFTKWFEKHKDWVEIGVHGYDHYPMEKPEWERDNAEELTEKSFDILKPFLPDKPLYRPPGFQILNRTAEFVKKLGFGGIAYQERIKYFGDSVDIYKNVFNTHCTLKNFERPIGRIWDNL